ncbi:YggS family pyridoxal phosphate-dependent enzyme [soil metagenome]
MTVTLAGPIASSLERVHRHIDEAAAGAGRDPSAVALIAVSKGFSAGAIAGAILAGQRDFAENRVQELAGKSAELGELVRWHFVGRLQRNKVRQVVESGAVIHSVDRLELAAEINRRAAQPVRVLVEVNVTGEPQKGGVEPEDLPRLVESALAMPNLEVIGLMTMARKAGDPELARPHFRELARLRDQLVQGYSAMIHHLSMGMSQDYRVAVEEGATMLRVGEAIFGPRTPPQTLGAEQLGESER